MNTETLTYHSDTEFKRLFVEQTVKHREGDRYIQRSYSNSQEADKFRGCSVGCSVMSLKLMGRNGIDWDDHAGLANLLGWPDWLILLQEEIFEGLPLSDAVMWTEKLASAVPVGIEIGMVKFRFLSFLMEENVNLVASLELDPALKNQVIESIKSVKNLHDRVVISGELDADARSAARFEVEAARSAARYAARFEVRFEVEAARSAARFAAASAAARSAAARSGAASVEFAASSATRFEAFLRFSRKLIELLVKST